MFTVFLSDPKYLNGICHIHHLLKHLFLYLIEHILNELKKKSKGISFCIIIMSYYKLHHNEHVIAIVVTRCLLLQPCTFHLMQKHNNYVNRMSGLYSGNI